MKKLFTLLFVLIATQNSFAEIIKGSVAWADGSVTEIANIDVPMLSLADGIYFASLQKGVKIEKDGVYRIYKPKEVKYFIFEYQGVAHKMVAIPKSFNAYWRFQIRKPRKKVFALLEIDGKMKGYRYYEKQIWNVLQHYQDPNYLIQPPGGQPNFMKFLLFKFHASKLVKDCEPARKLIRQRETLRQNPMDLVKVYNKNCG